MTPMEPRRRSVPDVRPGQVWEDNDWRSRGRLLLVLRVLPPDHPSERAAYVEVVRSRDNTSGPEDARARGRRRWIKLRRFRPTSTGYRLTDLTSEDVS